MTTLSAFTFTFTVSAPAFWASAAYRRDLPFACWPVLGGLMLVLAACGPAQRSNPGPSAAQLTVAPPPVPKTLESTLRFDAGVEEMPFYPQMAESAHGDIVAVWEQFDGEHYNIWANSRRAHQDWGRASLVHASETGHSYNPRVAINANGQAAAVWVQMDSAGGTYAVWSSRLEPGAGWGVAARVETGHAGLAYAPDVAIDERGIAVAAWQQSDGRRVNVRVSRSVPGVGWGQASWLERGDGDLGAPQVAVDAGGYAMVVWPRFHLSRSELWGSRFVPGQAPDPWDRAQRIDSLHGYVPRSQVMASATGSPGQFTVVWEQQQGFQTGVGASHYRPGRGWRTVGSECAAQLQAMGAVGADSPGSPARDPAPRDFKAAKADICY
jgi:hypothetical protein